MFENRPKFGILLDLAGFWSGLVRVAWRSNSAKITLKAIFAENFRAKARKLTLQQGFVKFCYAEQRTALFILAWGPFSRFLKSNKSISKTAKRGLRRGQTELEEIEINLEILRQKSRKLAASRTICDFYKKGKILTLAKSQSESGGHTKWLSFVNLRFLFRKFTHYSYILLIYK